MESDTQESGQTRGKSIVFPAIFENYDFEGQYGQIKPFKTMINLINLIKKP